jgi:hypothetical protein
MVPASRDHRLLPDHFKRSFIALPQALLPRAFWTERGGFGFDLFGFFFALPEPLRESLVIMANNSRGLSLRDC